MINPKHELFKWGPIDGRPCYVDPFVVAFEAFNDIHEYGWPDAIGYFKDDKIIYVLDYADLRDNGEHIFKKFILDDKERKERFETWSEAAERFLDFAKKDLSNLSDQELLGSFNGWDRLHTDFWVKGFIPEIANWGGEQLLKREIIKFNKLDFIDIFEKLSAPIDLSFFQKEELELMKIKLMPAATSEEALKRHKEKYYWIRNNYAETTVLDIDFFKDELNKITKEDAEKKIEEINNYVDTIKKKKRETISNYNVPGVVVNIAEKLAYCILWQDHRKSFIFIANHIITKFVKEASKRKCIDFKETCYYTVGEFKELLKDDKRIDAKARFDSFIEYSHEKGGITYMVGDKAKEFIKPYIETEIDPNLKEFSGMVVSKGKQSIYKGNAKIILGPDEVDKIEDGEILVSPMTSPDFIVAMRKAGAIITDEGGMTCHAAIVSRELGIPCIVATRIATKVLNDGQKVEVDAEKGIVKLL